MSRFPIAGLCEDMRTRPSSQHAFTCNKSASQGPLPRAQTCHHCTELDITGLAGFRSFSAVVKKTLDKKILPHLHLAALPLLSRCQVVRLSPKPLQASAMTREGALALTL